MYVDGMLLRLSTNAGTADGRSSWWVFLIGRREVYTALIPLNNLDQVRTHRN